MQKNNDTLFNIFIAVTAMLIFIVLGMGVRMYNSSKQFATVAQKRERVEYYEEDTDQETIKEDTYEDNSSLIESEESYAKTSAEQDISVVEENVEIEDVPVYEPWDLDFESEVNYIKSWCNEEEKYLGGYEYYNRGSYSYYLNNNTPVKIMIDQGYDEWDYNREYYGHGIFFVRIYNEVEECQLFYSEERLFRFIDADGIVHNYGDADWYEYDQIGQKCIQERRNICLLI